MSQQSNDNFDRLFRKAGNKYPLKTNNKNWDVVAARLNELKLTAKKKYNRRWQLAILLLLITAASVGFYKYIYQPSQLKLVAAKPLSKTSKTKNLQQQIFLVPDKKTISKSYTQVAPQPKQPKTFNDHYTSNTSFNTINNYNFSNQNNLVDHTNYNTEDFKLADISNSAPILNPSVILKQLNKNASRFALINNKTAVNNFNKQNNSQHIKLRAAKPATLYGSFFISPDFSTVKFQPINKPGFKIGVQLGYRINNNFSAELGLARYNSAFFSAGKYFDTSNIKLKPHTVIDKLYGKSKMTDIPFAIRYNFTKTNNHFFVAAGTSIATFLHTENYKYAVTRNGRPANISKHFNAITGVKYFSGINLSAGYEAPIIKFLKIKAEPYYQIPIKNAGVGNLPLTHFGLNVGIVKDLR